MKQTIEVPDKIIELVSGDNVKIYVKRKDLEFSVYCDGTGFIFRLTKEELREMLK